MRELPLPHPGKIVCMAANYMEDGYLKEPKPINAFLKSSDSVIATGETHSVREFLEKTFQRVGLPWKSHVEIDSRYMRPSEVDLLLGDATKAREKLGWQPQTSFEELVNLMVDADWQTARSERIAVNSRAA